MSRLASPLPRATPHPALCPFVWMSNCAITGPLGARTERSGRRVAMLQAARDLARRRDWGPVRLPSPAPPAGRVAGAAGGEAAAGASDARTTTGARAASALTRDAGPKTAGTAPVDAEGTAPASTRAPFNADAVRTAGSPADMSDPGAEVGAGPATFSRSGDRSPVVSYGRHRRDRRTIRLDRPLRAHAR